MIEDEIITLVSFYDTNENKDVHLKQLEDLLYQLDVQQGVIIGADFNNFTDNLKDQKRKCCKASLQDKSHQISHRLEDKP